MATDVSAQVNALDLALFNTIKTQSVPEDRRAWLAIQRALRPTGYVYLEIGSYRGGSLQQHLVDSQCRRLYSIDNRPRCAPDARGQAITYRVTTEDMFQNLRQLGPLDRLVTFESDARNVDRARIAEPPTFCFIDGQHTVEAVLSDFAFCMAVCHPNAAIAFHDAPLVMPALRKITADLRRRRVPFVTRKVLDAATFVVFLRDCAARGDAFFAEHAEDGSRWLQREPWRLRAQALIRRAYPIVSRMTPPVARRFASSVARRLVRNV